MFSKVIEPSPLDFDYSRYLQYIFIPVILQKYVPLGREVLGNNHSCPLLAQGIYDKQEDATVRRHDRDWECDVCGKRFISHDYLIQHFSRKHPDLSTPEAS